MKTINQKNKGSSKRITENRVNHLVDAKLKNRDKMLEAALKQDKIRNSYVKDKNWDSVEIIRKFREMK